MEVDTERLILRPFGEGDLADVVALNAGPGGMGCFAGSVSGAVRAAAL